MKPFFEGHPVVNVTNVPLRPQSTILALIPVLTATGRGADIMIPMAIPSFGGMVIAFITLFIIPVLYSAVAERRLHLD